MSLFRYAILLGCFLLTTPALFSCPTPGTYRIGASGDYPTINAAVQSLSGCTITGAYVFEFQADYHSQAESFPIIIPAIAGASFSNTLTFRPALGVSTVIRSAATGVFLFQGADFIRLDGRSGGQGNSINLTLENTSVGSVYTLQLNQDATQNSVRYCRILGASTVNTTGTVVFGSQLVASGNDDNLVEYCAIGDASSGTPLNGIYARGGSTLGVPGYNSGNIIQHNAIYNFYAPSAGCNGVFLDGANTQFSIIGNSFYQTTARTLGASRGYAAVFVFDNGIAGGQFTITDNFIGGSNVQAQGTQSLLGSGLFIPINIYAAATGTTLVARNTIRGINYRSNATSPSIQRMIGIFKGTVQCSQNLIEDIDYDWLGSNMILSAISAGITSGYTGEVTIQQNQIRRLRYQVTGAVSPRIWLIYFIDNPTAFYIRENQLESITTNSNNTFRGIAGLSTGNNNQIVGNRISNLTQTSTGSAAQLAGIFTQNSRSFTITDNEISQFTSISTHTGLAASASVGGIMIQSAGTNHVVQRNRISNLQQSHQGIADVQVTAIATSNATAGGTIQSNRIWDVRNAGSSSVSCVVGVMPQGGNWVIANNMISLTNSPHNNNMSLYGIWDAGAAGTRAYYHQSIYLGGTNGGAALSAALQFNANTGASAHIVNNILQVERGGGTGKYYCLGNNGPQTAGLVANHNIYNNANSLTLVRGVGGIDYALEDWQMASAGDGNSYTDIPVQFVDVAAGDLHLASAMTATPTAIESQGAVTPVLVDFDNQTRPASFAQLGGGSAPDLGADEVDLQPDRVAPVITFSPVSSPTCAAPRTLLARITDHSGVPQSGDRVPKLYFRKTTGTWHSVSGVRLSGNQRNAQWQFLWSPSSLGDVQTGDTVEYFVVAEDVIRQEPNVISLPSTGGSFSDVNTVIQPPTNPLSVSIQLNITGVWLGVSSNWNQPDNWCGQVPDSTQDVRLALGVVNYPIISSAVRARNLTVDSGVSLLIKPNGALHLSGDVWNDGRLTVDGQLCLVGSIASQRLTGRGIFDPLAQLHVRNTSGLGVRIERNLVIVDAWEPTQGVVTLQDADITLRSTATRTARVGVVGDSIAYAGNSQVVVERYFPARRAWRLVTAPLHSTGTIFQHWQESAPQGYQPGWGTFITGRSPSGATGNGLDWSAQNNFSMRRYSNNAYVDVTNTHVSLSAPGRVAANQAYFLFVRGDRRRSPDNTLPANNNATTLRSAGKLQTGTQSFAVSAQAGSYVLVGNPYASPVDFQSLAKQQVYSRRFYTFDPMLGQVGAFVVMEDIDGDGIFTPSNLPMSQQTNDIQSGQAFFVQPDASATSAALVFQEEAKTSGTTTSVFRPNSPFRQLRADLMMVDDSGRTQIADGALIEFDARFSASVDIVDALKFLNVNENAGWWRAGKLLAVERRPMPTEADTLFLRVSRLAQRNYAWELSLRLDPNQLLIPVLQDQFTGREQVLSGASTSSFTFSVNAQAASAAGDRFRIVFRKAAPSLLAEAKLHAGKVHIAWETNARSPMTHFNVLRSTNQQSFSLVGTYAVAANPSYAHTDDQVMGGQPYFYRVVLFADSVQVAQSNLMQVELPRIASTPYVFPNPSPKHHIQVYVAQQPSGSYRVRLVDAQGRVVWKSGAVIHAGDTKLELYPTGVMPDGIYYLQFDGPARHHLIVRLVGGS